MTSTATKTACPDADILYRYVTDQLPEAETAAVEVHLEHCGICEKAVEKLEQNGVGALPAPGTTAMSSVSPSQESLLHLLADPERIEKIPLPEFSVPKQIDKYEILEVLGSGGMGTVLRAKHVHLKREVAIKLVKGVRRFDSHAVSRFMQEIEAIGKLDHANIVRAHDAGVDEKIGQPYLVMELLHGQDVETLIKKRGPMSPTDACKLIRQAATGLDQIHQAGLVHRDVKPSNLFVTKSGIVKLLDFGLARLYENEGPQITSDMPTGDGSEVETHDGPTAGPLTSKMTILGSPLFMAPEQIEQSHRVDKRADIYSLGCTFYYLLTGKPPYTGSRFEVLAAHYHARFPSVGEQREDIPSALDDLIRSMTIRDPDERIGSAKEVVDVLDKFKESNKPKPPISVSPPLPPVRSVVKKSPVRIGLLTLGALLVFVFGAIVLLDRPTKRQIAAEVAVDSTPEGTSVAPQEPIVVAEPAPASVTNEAPAAVEHENPFEDDSIEKVLSSVIPSAPVETRAPPKATEPPEQIPRQEPPRPMTPSTSRPEPAAEMPQPIKVEPPVQQPVDPKNEPVNKLYWNKAMSGKMAFDFSKNKKCCVIGEGEHMFEVRWSTCTKTKVYVYNDPPSLEGVAIARGVTDPRRIHEASKLDFWERSREAALGSLVVLKNRHGKYAVLRITKIVDSYRTGAPNDWLEFDYYILPNGEDFSRMK